MTHVPLGRGAYDRQYANEPTIELLNRFLEMSPTNQVERTTLLARPGSTFYIGAGSGPIRVIAHQPGTFNNDLFFVSGETLYRWDGIAFPVEIAGTLALGGNPDTTFVSGPAYDHLFIADGLELQYYDGISAATAILTIAGGNIADTDVVVIDTAYYKFTSGSVDAGAPIGSIGDPWLIDLGTDDEDALSNLREAMELSGIAGIDYSTNTVINANVEGVTSDLTHLNVKARARGVDGNTIAVTETGAFISWTGATLAGGGVEQLNGVVVPDDLGIVSLATLASFALCVISNSQRFYWIRPGEVIIDALDFAEAESEPDQIIEAVRVGDSVYMLGQTSTEVWYASGDGDAPFIRQQGLAFSQGVLPGTVARFRSQLTVVADDGIVYEVAGGPSRVSNNGIEEHIRVARRLEAEGS